MVLAVACSAPALAFGGPDATPRPRGRTTEVQALRPAPLPVTEQQTTTTATATHEEIIQPLRQREESVNYRFAYRALTGLGLAGPEADDKPIGYQQIYGPTSMRVYHRPPPPPPRRFRHLAEPSDEPSVHPSPTPDAKPSPPPAPAPVAIPAGSPAASPTEPAAPGDLPEAGILPNPTQEAARSRTDEILSYFQRPPARTTQPPTAAPGDSGYGPGPYQSGADPAYLQAPEQMPIPPSRATYRVVPK